MATYTVNIELGMLATLIQRVFLDSSLIFNLDDYWVEQYNQEGSKMTLCVAMGVREENGKELYNVIAKAFGECA